MKPLSPQKNGLLWCSIIMTIEMRKYTRSSPLHSPVKNTATSEGITRSAILSKHRDGTDHLQANLHGILFTQPLDSHSPSLLTEHPFHFQVRSSPHMSSTHWSHVVTSGKLWQDRGAEGQPVTTWF